MSCICSQLSREPRVDLTCRRYYERLRSPHEVTWSVHRDAVVAGKQLEDGERKRMREELGTAVGGSVGGVGIVPIRRPWQQVHLKVAGANCA